MFTIDLTARTNSVYTVDVSPTGPVGLYTITYSPDLTSECMAATSDVVYDVNIINPCEVATLTIDPTNSVFLPLGSISAYRYVMEPLYAFGVLSWDSDTDITSSITWTDPCGAIT